MPEMMREIEGICITGGAAIEAFSGIAREKIAEILEIQKIEESAICITGGGASEAFAPYRVEDLEEAITKMKR